MGKNQRKRILILRISFPNYNNNLVEKIRKSRTPNYKVGKQNIIDMSYKSNLTEEILIVPAELSNRDKIYAYWDIYKKIRDESDKITIDKQNALDKDDAQLNLEIDKEAKRISAISTPFVIGQLKAEDLKSKGYKLSSYDGDLEPTSTPQAQSGDIIVSLFMILFDAVAEDLLNDIKSRIKIEIEENNLLKPKTPEEYFRLTSGLFVVQIVRDLVIDPSNNGELAKLVRDPLKRPVEIIKNLGKKIEDTWKNDNGDIGNFFKKPFG